MSIPQRSYVYLAAFAASWILLQGAYGLATDLTGSLGGLLSGDTPDATWIAMVIVALPVWAAHELILRRAAKNHPEEAASALRKLYVHGALFLAALYMFFGGIQVAEQLALDDDGLEHIGGIIVAAALWYYLWRREKLEGQPGSRAQTVQRWRIYGLSVLFLTTAVTGAFWILAALAYIASGVALADTDLLITGETDLDALRTTASWAIVGTVAWVVQWETVANRDEESVLRQVYLYGFAFIGGASLALWGAAAAIYFVIAKLVGADDTTTTVAYIRQFILPAISLLIGLALLAYHWSIIRRDATRKVPTVIPAQAGIQPSSLTESPHLSVTFKYIMSAVGLIALVPGVMVLIMTILFLLTEGDLLSPAKDDAEALAVALTMIIVGAPLWFTFWWRVVRADPNSLIRRIYLYVTLIALGGTTLITLITLLAAVLTEILGQGSGFLDDALIPGLSIVLPAAAFFAYHVMILRDDSRRTPALTAETLFPPGPTHYIVPAPPYAIPTKSALRPE